MSDQTTNSEAPDGGTTDSAGDPGEVMTRAEARKLIDQRQELKAKNAELEAKIAKMDSGAKPDGPPAPSPPPPAPDMPEWAQSLVSSVMELGTRLDTHQTSTARAAVEAKVLASVPDGNHATARALLGTLGVDFTQPGAAADALAKLREQHYSAVMVDHTRGSQPLAPAKKPDGSPDFASYRTFDEVPDAFKSAAMRDPETYERLRGGGGQSHGLNI